MKWKRLLAAEVEAGLGMVKSFVKEGMLASDRDCPRQQRR